MIRVLKLIVIVQLLLILLASCKKGVTDNGIIEEAKQIKTPREMTWTADTLRSPDPTSFQLMMRNILAFSSTDIWICGWSDVARGLIWHYDGKMWSESNIRDDVGGMRVNDIAGYSSNDLWACGYSGDNIFLAHYNGQHWTRENDMGIKGELLDMCKDPNGNLWACGRNGVIMKYDKTKWIVDTIDLKLDPNYSYWLMSIEYFNGKMHILASTAHKITLKETYYYIEGDIHNFAVIDSFTIGLHRLNWGYIGLCAFPQEQLLYSYGLAGLWSYTNGWQKNLDVDGSIYGLCCLSKDYKIAVGDYQQLFFNNGNGWVNFSGSIPQIGRYFISSTVWTDGFETFIIGYGNSGTIIFHGK